MTLTKHHIEHHPMMRFMMTKYVMTILMINEEEDDDDDDLLDTNDDDIYTWGGSVISIVGTGQWGTLCPSESCSNILKSTILFIKMS